MKTCSSSCWSCSILLRSWSPRQTRCGSDHRHAERDRRSGGADAGCVAPEADRRRRLAFRGRRGDRIKLLFWDGQGFCLYVTARLLPPAG
ncbi:IS66 family insertion sequence element accessory protein TnpB [Aminobacter sp. J44]|uniref:IS66 family insertion sequence element accessory protein TnpB n=1 Tax=Aminobacter sp. J44 TaxID=935262 RepID=UPI001AEECF6A|nr:IS66 family insertion sequence element accessory protein TnpB [Aminobacter sp. J44]